MPVKIMNKYYFISVKKSFLNARGFKFPIQNIFIICLHSQSLEYKYVLFHSRNSRMNILPYKVSALRKAHRILRRVHGACIGRSPPTPRPRATRRTHDQLYINAMSLPHLSTPAFAAGVRARTMAALGLGPKKQENSCDMIVP